MFVSRTVSISLTFSENLAIVIMAFLNPFFNIKKTEKVDTNEEEMGQKLDKGTLNRLKKATNLTEDSLIARHQEFNKMFPEKEGIVRPSEEFCKNPQILREKTLFEKYTVISLRI